MILPIKSESELMSVWTRHIDIPKFVFGIIFCGRTSKKCDLFYLSTNRTVSKTNNNVVATYILDFRVYFPSQCLLRLSVVDQSCCF